ncbi:MAG: TlpA family protein disulfide reductase [Actinomycetota bacterium]
MSEELRETDACEEGAQTSAPAARSARRRALNWSMIVCVVAAISFFSWRQFSRTGGSASGIASAYGFKIGDFRAQSRRETRPAPALAGEEIRGGRLALSDYRGKVVVVNLWASWCAPCRLEQPVFERLWREYKARGVQFLGINIRDQKVAALAFLDEFTVTYPSFYDRDAFLVSKLGAQVLPTTYIIAVSGRIFFRFTGTVDEPLLRTAIDAALEPEAQASGG